MAIRYDFHGGCRDELTQGGRDPGKQAAAGKT